MGGLQRTPPGSGQRSQRLRRPPRHLDDYEVEGGGTPPSPPPVVGGVKVVHTPIRPLGGRGRRGPVPQLPTEPAQAAGESRQTEDAGLGRRAVAADFFLQPRLTAPEPLRSEEGRRLGESQELLNRLEPLLGQPEQGRVQEEQGQVEE